MTLMFTECKDKKYGLNCSENCGNCRDLRQCHYINGSCLNGCSPGFQGKKCTMGSVLFSFQPQHLCPEYYTNMSYSIQYLGYVLIQYFFIECAFGFYGIGCLQECSSFCKISRNCHHVTGLCKDGCKNGWQGNNCFEGMLNKCI